MCRTICLSVVFAVLACIAWGVIHILSGSGFELDVQRISPTPYTSGSTFRISSEGVIRIGGYDVRELCARGDLGPGSRLFVDGVEQDCSGTRVP